MRYFFVTLFIRARCIDLLSGSRIGQRLAVLRHHAHRRNASRLATGPGHAASAINRAVAVLSLPGRNTHRTGASGGAMNPDPAFPRHSEAARQAALAAWLGSPSGGHGNRRGHSGRRRNSLHLFDRTNLPTWRHSAGLSFPLSVTSMMSTAGHSLRWPRNTARSPRMRTSRPLFAAPSSPRRTRISFA